MTNQIIWGDSLKVVHGLPHARMAWADPPDNLGMKYDGFKDRWPSPKAYASFLTHVAATGCAQADVFWLSCYHTYQPVVWSWYETVREAYRGFSCRMFLWVYTFGQHRSDDCGNGYRPLFRFHWGDRSWNTDAIRVESQRQRNGDKRADPRGRVPDDVWFFPRVCGTFKERRKWIPCQHPEGLVERMVKLSTQPGDTVVDMFAGSGVTHRIADRCGVKVYGIDVSETYCCKIAEETGAEFIKHESAPKEQTLFEE
jgi:hypothetical protein